MKNSFTKFLSKRRLLRHISKDDLPSLYWSDVSRRTEYYELMGFVYMMLRRAIREGADRIVTTNALIIWSREGKTINKIDIDPTPLPDYPKSYADELRKIVTNDPVVKNSVKIVRDTNNDIILDLFS